MFVVFMFVVFWDFLLIFCLVLAVDYARILCVMRGLTMTSTNHDHDGHNGHKP